MAADQGNQFAICAKGQMCILRCVTCDGQLELDKGARSTLNLEGRNGTKGGLEKKERGRRRWRHLASTNLSPRLLSIILLVKLGYARPSRFSKSRVFFLLYKRQERDKANSTELQPNFSQLFLRENVKKKKNPSSFPSLGRPILSNLLLFTTSLLIRLIVARSGKESLYSL